MDQLLHGMGQCVCSVVGRVLSAGLISIVAYFAVELIYLLPKLLIHNDVLWTEEMQNDGTEYGFE